MEAVDEKSGMTAGEQVVMAKLMEAYQAFIDLPRQHPDEIRDFVDGVHRIQDVLAVRIVRRVFPLGWPTHSVQNSTPPKRV